MRLKAEDYVYKEKRIHLKRKHIAPHFFKAGNGLVVCNAHCSIYSFTEDIKDKIIRSGSTRHWRPVHYSKYLIMDVDSKLAGLFVTDRLKELDVTFYRFDSGHKGYHFAVLREAEPYDLLCYQDKDLVFELFKDLSCFNDIDLSIYSPMRVIRAVGCYHEKSHRVKMQDMEYVGQNMLTVVGREVSQLEKRTAGFELESIETNYDRVIHSLLSHTANMGTKYHSLWALAKDLFKSGLSSHAVLEIASIRNATFDNPKQHTEVERAVNDARRAVFGK